MPSLAKSLTSIYSVNIFNGVMGVVLIPISLKLLGAEGYGLFSIYTVIASFVALLDVGIGKSLQRALSSKGSAQFKDRQISTACGAYLLVLAALAAVLPALIIAIPNYVFPVEESLKNSIRWIVFLSCIEYILFIPLAVGQSICFAKEEFHKHAQFSLFSGVARYAILFAAIYFLDSIILIIGAYVLRRALDWYLIRRIMGPLPPSIWRPSFHIKDLRELSVHALGLSVTRLLQTILISMGSVLVNRSFGLESLGYFRVAFDLASKVWFLSNGIGLVAYPKFVKAFADKEKSDLIFLRLRYAMIFSWMIFLSMGLVASCLSSTVLPRISVSNAAVISLFIPMVLGVCINAHANLGYEVIQAAGRYRLLNSLTILSIVLMLVAFYAMESKLKLMAVAWAWLASQIVYSITTDLAAMDLIVSSARKTIESAVVRALSAFLAVACVLALINDFPKTIYWGLMSLQVTALASCFIFMSKKLRTLNG